MKFIAVVVTYNRIGWLKRNIEALLAQTKLPDEIIVVDNASTDGTHEFLQNLSNEKIKIEKLSENIGGAGGFAYGIKKAIENGADWIWIMDDDALPYREALEEIEWAISSSQDKQIDVFLSKIVDSADNKPKRTLVRVFTGTFVGFTISKKVVEKIGLPDPDFFIYADDYDYCERIKKAGFKLFMVNSSLIEHKDWVRQKPIFRFPFVKPKIPPWKVYYIFRNPILATKHSFIINLAVKGYLSVDRYIWSYVDPSVKPFAFKGFSDGRKGFKGKIVDPKNSKI